MICSKCGLEMKIAKAKYTTDIGTTDIFYEATFTCLNPQCEDFDPQIENPVKFKVEKTLVYG